MCVVVLPFRELEPLPGSRLPRLLPLDRPGVSGQQAVLPQLDAMHFIHRNQRASHCKAKRARLSGQAPAVYAGSHVESPEGISHREALLYV